MTVGIKFRTLRAKFLALIVPLILFSTILVFGFSELAARRDAYQRLQAKLEELVDIQSSVLSQPMWNITYDQVQLVLAAIMIDPDVLGVIVFDESNNLLASAGVIDEIEKQVYFAEKDITYISGDDIAVIGRLGLALTDDRIRAESQSRLLLLTGLAASLLLSVIVIALVANRKTIGIPLEKLLLSINRSREREEHVPVDWSSRDEIGEVVSAFNEMQLRQQAYETELRNARDDLETRVEERTQELAEKSNTLELLSNQLGKYLSPQIYESIFKGKQEVKVESKRKKLTIFFSDLAGFTETSDRLESEDLTNLINNYLTEMSRIAMDFGATVDKYMGDGIVIFFGDPETRGEMQDALQCVNMALAMRERMRGLADEWRESGIEKPMKARMGIHTGFCTVGNIGSEARMDYTIIGGSVNTASRLESAATPGEILVSFETFSLVKDKIQCEERGSIEVKGIAYPVATYQVIDSYENLKRQHEHFHETHPHYELDLDLDAMTATERSEATKLLQKGLGLLQEDSQETQKKSKKS